MKKRKLAILSLIAIFIILIAIFVWVARSTPKTNSTENKFVSNTGVVYGQGSSLLEYNECTYMIADINKAIVKYDYKSNKLSNIHISTEGFLGDNLYIINNKLIYTLDNVTYYCNLDGSNNTKFFDGKLLYIDDEIYVCVIEDTNLLQYLYIVSYNNSNFKKTGNLEYNLANGNEIKFLRKSDEILLFSSVNSDASSSLFFVDIVNYKSKLLVKESDTDSSMDIIDAIKNDDYVFYIVSSTGGDGVTNNTLYFVPIEGTFTELQADYVGDNIYEIPTGYKGVVYELYSNDHYTLKDIHGYYSDIKFFDVVYGDITKFFKYRDLALSLNDSKLVDFEQKYIDYYLTSVTYVNDKLYIVLNKDSSYAYFSCNQDGSELINIR